MINLKLYLDSKGRDLPPQHAHHKRGGKFEKLCVLCEEKEHNNWPVPYYEHPNILFGVLTDTFCCDSCNDELQQMTSKFSLWDMFDKVSIHEVATRRKLLAKSPPEFDETLFFHLEETVVPTLRRRPENNSPILTNDLCYVCKEDTAFEDYEIIETPRLPRTKLQSGGFIRICLDCADLIDHYSFINIKYETTKCVGCGMNYAISRSELLELESLHIGEDAFKCPKCVRKSILPHHSGNMMRGLALLRHEMQCEFCKNNFFIDLRLSSNILRSYWSKKVLPTCPHCLRAGQHPDRSYCENGIVMNVYIDDDRRTIMVSNITPRGVLMDETYTTVEQYIEGLFKASSTYFYDNLPY